MARPRNCRYVERTPSSTYFKPCGVPMSALDEVRLSVEGLEALRLADLEGMTATAAAARLRVSRHTFGRTLAEARHAVAEALVHGRALRIEGGAYALLPGPECRRESGLPGLAVVVAISSEGPTLEDQVDPRYGRAGGFLLATFADGDLRGEPVISYLDNGDAQILARDAGVATTAHLAQAGVTAVMSGRVGRGAWEALEQAGIAVIEGMDGQTVAKALACFRRGDYRLAEGPSPEAIQGT